MSLRPTAVALATALLVGCAGRGAPKNAAPAPNDAWLIFEPSAPALCLPWLGEPDEAVVAQWRQVVSRLQAHDVAAARSELGPVGPDSHPALQGLGATVALVTRDVGAAAGRLDSLLRDAPESTCLLATSAQAQNALGNRQEAATRIGLAQRLARDDAEVALVFAFMSPVEEASRAIPALEAGATVSPERLAFAVALGAAAITTGDAERAVTWLERAHECGDELSTAMLLMAYRGAERTDDYLRLAARMGLPVPGDLATDETPLDTLLEGFGVARGEHVPVTLHTSLGDAHCELFPEVAPITVNSFLGLATGTIPWITPDGDLGQGPLYRDLPFHRVIPEFMVQTGDPEGTGKGGPGYRFPDEVDNQLRFDEPGRLAMANGGPDSNGSQFFITEKPARHLDGRHTIFGQCDEASVSLVERIARADEVVTLESVEVPGMPVPAPTPFPPPPEDDKL